MAETELDGRFEIGATISRAFGTIGSNFLLFCGLALVLAGIPQFLLEFWQRMDGSENLAVGAASMFQVNWTAFAVTWVVSIISSAILQAALTRATVMDLSGEKPQFAQALGVGIRLALPMIAIGLLSAIGIGIGFALLIVPGIILWLVWSVVTPAYVQEKIGVFEAFGRSAELTSGARWRIFLTMLVVGILLWVLAIPVGFVTAAVATTGSALVLAIVTAIASALGNMIFVAVQASIYVELRQLKEGIAPADLEAIFA